MHTMKSDLISGWEHFYRDFFGIEADLSNLGVPEKRNGFERLIIVAKGMSPHRIYDKCVTLFPCYKWTNENLDEIVISDRNAKNGAYAVWIRDRIEADEELKNMFAYGLKEQNVPGITLEERLVYELKYFKETGGHLDMKNITLSTGSRYSNGSVPTVSWLGGTLWVYWYFPDVCCCGPMRSRETVI